MTQPKHRGTKGWAEVTGSSVSLDFKCSHLATKRPSHMFTPAYKGPSHHVHTWLQSGLNNPLPRGRCSHNAPHSILLEMTSTCFLTNEGRVWTGMCGTFPIAPVNVTATGENERPCVWRVTWLMWDLFVSLLTIYFWEGILLFTTKPFLWPMVQALIISYRPSALPQLDICQQARVAWILSISFH